MRVVTVHMRANGSAPAVEFKKGDRVDHRNSEGVWGEEPWTIVAVALDHELVPYYQIKLGDREKNTLAERLRHAQPSVASQPPAPSSTKKRSMVPMTKDQYEEIQSVVREVWVGLHPRGATADRQTPTNSLPSPQPQDPESGRMRLVKGTGEIIERIVSRDEHAQINRDATLADGVHGAAVAAARARGNT